MRHDLISNPSEHYLSKVQDNPPRYRVGAQVFYSCDQYLILGGSDRLICLPNGRWNGTVPYADYAATCRGIYFELSEKKESFHIKGLSREMKGIVIIHYEK